MHGNEKADVLIVDEATMMHFGLIILAATKLGAKEVVCFADHEQVSFINRSSTMRVHHEKILHTAHYQSTHIYRVPQDIAKVLSRNYGKITTSNKIKSSIVVKISPNPIDVLRNMTNTTVLTFKQSEKKTVKATYPDREVMTVHEAEGITRKRIALVRMGVADNHLYMPNENKLNPHQLVGISRCTEELVYITVKRDFLKTRC